MDNVADQDRAWLALQIKRMQESKFYGVLSLNFNEGQIVNIKREESMKPPRAGMKVDRR